MNLNMLRRLPRLFARLAVASFIVFPFGPAAVAAEVASLPDPASDPAYLAYAKPGQLVALSDGRKIHLLCQGSGSPTVILTAGFSDWSAQWSKVHAVLARQTRTCSWDRAGYGFSDPSPLPQDVLHTTSDLEAALHNGGIAGPYILVGHSLGGFESLLFADRHRSEVAGMVLADPSIPGQARRFRERAPKLAAAFDAMGRQYIQRKKSCGAQVERGTLTSSSADPDNCLSYNPAYPDALQQALRKMDGNPARWQTRVSLMAELNRSSEEVLNRQRNYGAMPLRVLTAGELGDLPSNFDAATLAQGPALQAESLRGHEAIAKLSSNGADIVVPGTTHYIQFIKPEVVIDAVSQVIEVVRIGARR